MRLLRVKPWRWTGEEPTRDVWRVRSMPGVFRARCIGKGRARTRAEFTNLRLMATGNRTVADHPRSASAIVGPLVAALGLPNTIIAARLTTLPTGAAASSLVTSALGDKRCAAHSYSPTPRDATLLDACGHCDRLAARLRNALSGVYLPRQCRARSNGPARTSLRGICRASRCDSDVVRVRGVPLLPWSAWRCC
jgi:hypothetical protein